MNADELKAKMEAAGCCFTSAGFIAVDNQKFTVSYIGALQTIERLECAMAEAPLRIRIEANVADLEMLRQAVAADDPRSELLIRVTDLLKANNETLRQAGETTS